METVQTDGRIFGRAESVEIESDENGWELKIVDDDGRVFVFDVHAVSQDLAREARKIDRYWAEGAALAASHVVNDGDGYDADDPKRPGYLDRADAIRDRERSK